MSDQLTKTLIELSVARAHINALRRENFELMKRVSTLHGTLLFYENDKNWRPILTPMDGAGVSRVEMDRGRRARNACRWIEARHNRTDT